MYKKKIMLTVVAMLCAVMLLAAFVGCDGDTPLYKVEFETNGGSTIDTVSGTVQTEPQPEKDGCDFAGWYVDEQYSGERITFPYTPQQDVTLYAKWQGSESGEADAPNFNIVTFESNGGSQVGQVIGVVKKEPLPTKENCTFEGWYFNSYFGGDRVSFPYTPQSNVTLYAKWKVDFSKTIAINEIVEGLKGKTDFKADEAFGISIAATAAGLVLSLDAYIDPSDVSDVQIRLAISDDGNEVVTLYADDANIYAVSPNAKKRFVNVNLAGFLTDAEFSSPDDMAYGVVSMVLNLLFSEGTASRSGEIYTLEGNLKGAVDMIKLLTPDVPSEIIDVLGTLDVTAVADLTGGTLNSLKLGLGVGEASAEITMNELMIANGFNPVTGMPAKDESGYDESYALNFTLEGSATLSMKENDYSETDLVTFDYTLRVDYNIFEALRNCINKQDDGTITFDVSQLFNTCDSKIYLDISHRCDENCSEFCAGKVASSRGSILTLAYSPEDFGNTKLNAAVNLKYLLPQGFIESLAGDAGSILYSLIGEYVGANLDLEALLMQGEDSASAADELNMVGNAIASLPDFNIVALVKDVVNFAAGLDLNDSEGLVLGTVELLDLLDTLTPVIGTSLSNILYPFFGGAEQLSIKVDKAIWGDPETTTMDMYRKFMIIHEDEGDYKDFDGGEPTKSVEWATGSDGNVILRADGVSTHDGNCDAIKLTAEEIQAIMTGGVAVYDATLVNGERVENVEAEIIKVLGLDYSIVDEPQEVTIVTAMTDNGALTSLLSLISTFMPGVDLTIPGAVVRTQITISSVKSVEFYQDGIENPIDPSTEYKYGDLLNPQHYAKIIFGDGSERIVTVMPENSSDYFSGSGSSSKVQYFGDFTLTYEAFGRTFTVDVDMADQLIVPERETVYVQPGVAYTVSKSHKVTYDKLDGLGTEASLSITGTETSMQVPEVEGMTAEKAYKSVIGIQMFDGYNLTFAEGGEYDVDVAIGKGYVKQYRFVVADAVELPGAYSSELVVVDGDTMQLTFRREDQRGDGYYVKFEVTVDHGDGEIVLGQQDIRIYTVSEDETETEIDAFFLEAFMLDPATVYIDIVTDEYKFDSSINVTAKIRVYAPDYGNLTVSENSVEEKTQYYSITAQNTWTVNEHPDTIEGNLLEVAPVCDPDNAVSGIKLSPVVQVKIDGEEEWRTIDASDVKFGTVSGSKFSSVSNVRFTENGKFGSSVQYLLINDEQVSAATSTVEYRIDIIATNYNNVVVASTSGTIVIG